MPIRDPILDARFKAFRRQNLGASRHENIDFEHFVNYFILASEMPTNEAVTPERVRANVHTGKSGDRALDGVALFVQRKLATTTCDVDGVIKFFHEEHNSLDADFYFIQTTTTPSFDNAKVLKFLHGVQQFLSAEAEDREAFTGEIQGLWDVKEYLLRDNGVFLKKRPTLHLYYAYTGAWRMPFTDKEWWQKDTNLDPSVRNMLRDISHNNPSLCFEVIDASRLLKIHEDLNERRVVAERVPFRYRVSVPDGDDGRKAYIGIMNCREYIDKMAVYPGTRELNENLFIDNVRRNQGDTPVNKGIATSLQDETKKNEFMLLNNGITIVARRARVEDGEDTCTIYNYQIVNGCQTTHVLNANYDDLNENTFVPVKLVVTQNERLIDEIVFATNTQNEVSADQFRARDAMQRDLEAYYTAQNENDKGYRELTYQRQTAAYGESRYEGSAVIDRTTQLMCYEAMFDEERPHVAAGRKSTPNDQAYTRIFNAGKNPLQAFHVAGYALCEMESFIKEHYSSSSKIDEPLNYKYHLLLLFKIMQQDSELPPAKSMKVEIYCDKLRGILSDQAKRKTAFRDAVSILEEGLAWYKPWWQSQQSQKDQNSRYSPHTAQDLTAKLTELAKSRAATANAPRRGSQASNRRARSETTPQASSAPAANNAADGNMPQQAPAANLPSQPEADPQQQAPATPTPSQPKVEPQQQAAEATTSSQTKARRRTSSDDNVLTGTIVGFDRPPGNNSDWYVYVSTSDGESKQYYVRSKEVRAIRKKQQLTKDNAVGKVIRFKLTGSHRTRKDIPKAEILSVVS